MKPAQQQRLRLEARRAVAKLEAAKREAKRVKDWEKALELAEQARTALAAAPQELFTDRPHPHPYFASQGKTLRDHYLFFLERPGGRTSVAVCKAILAANPPPQETP